MPWRGPEVPGEYPTLGWQVVDLIESRCVIPDGPRAGEPFVLTNEQVQFFLRFYRLRPDARIGDELSPFVYFRGAQLVRPQKWGKGPITASHIVAEVHPEGPVLFAGWDAYGEPVGKPWATPHVQVTAYSQDQTDNIWRALKPMIDLSPSLSSEIPDTGIDRINVPGGGLIEPVTSSANSRLGARVTFAPQDETHSWTHSNGMRRVADVQRRGLAGMDGRFVETTNAWDPADQSVAQQTYERSRVGLLVDDVEPGEGSIRNERDRHRMIRKVYGDSLWKPDGGLGWVRLSRIDAEILELMDRDAAQAERFFLNRKRAAEAAAFDVDGKWIPLARRGYRPAPGALIVLGVDGARFRDALGIIGIEVATGFTWVVGCWERPENAPDDYEHPRGAIDGTMEEAFDEFTVWRAYVDPQHIEHLFDGWRGKYGEDRVLPWWTNRPKQMAWAIRGGQDSLAAADFTHDGDEQFTQHMRNAVKWPTTVKDDQGRPMHLIGKETADSPRKMDLAASWILARECRGDAIAAGATKPAAQDTSFYIS
jgi:hypothetical protein